MPDARELQDYFKYDPTTGVITARRGNRVGTKHTQGYLKVWYGSRKDGGHILFHRLAWLLHYGNWPKMNLDHINGDKTDNRIVNLREADHQENALNSHFRRNGHRRGKVGRRA